MPAIPEQLKPNNPSTVALEIVALGFLTWQLRNRYYRNLDQPNKPKPGDYPLVDMVGDSDVYVRPDSERVLVVGEVDPIVGLVEIRAVRETDETGEEKFYLESASTEDPTILGMLKSHLVSLRDIWNSRINGSTDS
ncbi:MAG: hypothetical protein ABSD10_01190 [Candidatus Saccharimonadales bacterium]|jgi:hypothetical protein